MKSLKKLYRGWLLFVLFVQSLFSKKSGVVLHITNSGRHIPFLLFSFLYKFNSISISRNSCTLLVKSALRIPSGRQKVTLGRRYRDPDFIEVNGKRMYLDYAYFSNTQKQHLPFYEHPAAFEENSFETKSYVSFKNQAVFFAGTAETPSYEEQFHFPVMNRNAVIKTIKKHFKPQIEDKTIELVITNHAVNSINKYTLNRQLYFKKLQSSRFALCPPGIRIPHSHNLVEAMKYGAVPIVNYNEYLYPGLEHKVNALVFSTEKELLECMEYALHIDAQEYAQLSENAVKHYNEFYNPKGIVDGIDFNKDLVVNVSILSPEASGII